MKDCCIFDVEDLKQAFHEADFEEIETFSVENGEDPFGGEFCYAETLVRCRKCGALCLKIERNSYEFLPWGDTYDTVYLPVAEREEAKKVNGFETRRRYIRETENEFRGVTYLCEGSEPENEE